MDVDGLIIAIFLEKGKFSIYQSWHDDFWKGNFIIKSYNNSDFFVRVETIRKKVS